MKILNLNQVEFGIKTRIRILSQKADKNLNFIFFEKLKINYVRYKT